jgi:predicted nuclease of predicted toxin-antitoxin system
MLKFKIDENLPVESALVLRTVGHDAVTLGEEGIQGRPDDSVAELCGREGRVLVTLDLDFSDIRSYPPREHSGIVVFRLGRQDRDHVLATLRRLLPAFEAESPRGRLWVVDEHRIRVRS